MISVMEESKARRGLYGSATVIFSNTIIIIDISPTPSTVTLWYPQGTDFRTTLDAKICGCSSSLYKMA